MLKNRFGSNGPNRIRRVREISMLYVTKLSFVNDKMTLVIEVTSY